MKVSLLLLLFVCVVPSAALAQFKEAEPVTGSTLGTPVKQKLKVGVVIRAEGGPCLGIIATVPVPSDWPEQQVTVVDEELSPPVRNLRYRTSAGQLRQMVVDVPQLAQGQEARAIVTLEVAHAPQIAPKNTADFVIPKKLDRQLTLYVGSSPQIETRHAKITALAKQFADKETAWEQVAAIYDYVQSNVELKKGDVKGAARALNDKNGDAEDQAALFIALCRANKIPARTVWVNEHCYAEFYLVDAAGKGYWFPCQAGGTKQFGGIDETRPILMKGDNFKDPDRPRERMRYVSEFVKGAGGKGSGRPKVQFIRETIGG